MFSPARKFVSHRQQACFQAKLKEFVSKVLSLAIKHKVQNRILRCFTPFFPQLPCVVYKGLFSQGWKVLESKTLEKPNSGYSKGQCFQRFRGLFCWVFFELNSLHIISASLTFTGTFITFKFLGCACNCFIPGM